MAITSEVIQRKENEPVHERISCIFHLSLFFLSGFKYQLWQLKIFHLRGERKKYLLEAAPAYRCLLTALEVF